LAEGVEREEHMDFLLKEGCPQVQGFLFGRPMPLSEISHVVNRPPSEPSHSLAGQTPAETIHIRSAVA
jgi:sensor c-di-GMP phosphodiesterase-like protein